MLARRLYAKLALAIGIASWLVPGTLTAPALAEEPETTASIAVEAGIPFTTPPVSFETIGGTEVSVSFTATSSTSGTVRVVAGGRGRFPVFSINAPAGATLSRVGASITGEGIGWLVSLDVMDAAGGAIARCDTATISFAIGDKSTVMIPSACQVPGTALELATGTTSVVPSPRDARYFPQTGFRVDNEAIWDYFVRRGGVATFGYPVSRTFLFQGFPVQLFQRRVVQLDQNGQPRLLNLLDPGLLPYSSFNLATLPPFDATLVATAPNPRDFQAVLDWVRSHAPDRFRGLPVSFYQTFLNTVPVSAAFPSDGDSGRAAGLGLEMWGIPTSEPMVDPNNPDFVYLRWQRGVMQFDRRCGCTQGILLGDYLKAILTGDALPADLDQEAKDSPLYRQYDPGRPNWVRDPTLLPNTALNVAFLPIERPAGSP